MCRITQVTAVMMSGRSKTFACCGLLLLVWFEGVHSQAYHFSKGWMPGRKRSPGPPPFAGEQTEQEAMEPASYQQNVYCQVRPQVRKVIADVIRVSFITCTHVCMYSCVHVCMHVCMCVFIHLFIQTISIGPLQVHYYSEALLTQHGYCAGVSCRCATRNCELRTCPRFLRVG